MGRSLNRAASLINGFNAMYDTIGRVQSDRELSRLAGEKPMVETLPNDPVQQPAAPAAPDPGGNPANPAPAPAPAAPAAPRQRTTFLGKTVDGTMDDAAVSKARQLAIADFYERKGQVDKSNSIRSTLQQQDDADFNRSRVKLRAKREDEQYAKEDAFKTDIAGITSSSIFGQKQKEFAGAMSKFEADMKAHNDAVAAGKSSTAPTRPAMPSMTPGERLLDATNALTVMAKHGRATPEMQDKLAAQMQSLNDEGYLTFLRMAGSGATGEQLAAAYNASGKGRIDPRAISDIKRVKRPDGVESSIITVQQPDGTTETIDTFTELSRLGKAGEAIDAAKRALEVRKQDASESNATRLARVQERNAGVNESDAARRSQEFNAGAPGRAAQAEVAKLQLERLKPETTPERRAQIEALLTQGAGKAGAPAAKVEAGDVVSLLGEPALDPRTKQPIIDPMTGRQVVNRNPARERDFFNFMSAAGMRTTDEGLLAYKSMPDFASEAALNAAIKAGQVKPGAFVRVGGVTGRAAPL